MAELKAMIKGDTRKARDFRRTTAALTAAVFLFSTIGTPFAEANFWKDRRDVAERRASADSRLARLPADVHAMPDLPDPLAHRGAIQRLSGAVFAEGTPGGLSETEIGEALRRLPESLRQIPSSHGTIRRVRLVPDLNAPLVVLIQDAHDIESAQRNVSGILERLHSGRNALLVGVEGSAGPFDIPQFRKILDDKPSLRFAADVMLQKAFISGADFYGLTAEKEPVLWGLEDEPLYMAHVNAYRASRRDAAALENYVASASTRVRSLKAGLYSEELQEYDALLTEYDAGGKGLRILDYFASRRPARLQSYPQAALLARAAELEKGLDWKQVEAERADLVRTLGQKLQRAELDALARATLAYRAGRTGHAEYYRYLKEVLARSAGDPSARREFARYMDYVLLVDRVDAARLFEEMEALKKEVLDSLAETPAQKALAAASEKLSRLAKLVRFELTPAEWDRYAADREAVLALDRALDALDGKTAPGAASVLSAEKLKNFEEFYAVALKRDKAMVDSLLAGMETAKEEGARGLAVMIAGGFHTPGVERELAARGLSVVTVMPRIEAAGKGADYLEFFSERGTPIEKLLLGDRLMVKSASAFSPMAAFVSHRNTTIALLVSLAAAFLVRFSADPGRTALTVADRLNGGSSRLIDKIAIRYQRSSGNIAVDVRRGKTSANLNFDFARSGAAAPGGILSAEVRDEQGRTVVRIDRREPGLVARAASVVARSGLGRVQDFVRSARGFLAPAGFVAFAVASAALLANAAVPIPSFHIFSALAAAAGAVAFVLMNRNTMAFRPVAVGAGVMGAIEKALEPLALNISQHDLNRIALAKKKAQGKDPLVHPEPRYLRDGIPSVVGAVVIVCLLCVVGTGVVYSGYFSVAANMDWIPALLKTLALSIGMAYVWSYVTKRMRIDNVWMDLPLALGLAGYLAVSSLGVVAFSTVSYVPIALFFLSFGAVLFKGFISKNGVEHKLATTSFWMGRDAFVRTTPLWFLSRAFGYFVTVILFTAFGFFPFAYPLVAAGQGYAMFALGAILLGFISLYIRMDRSMRAQHAAGEETHAGYVEKFKEELKTPYKRLNVAAALLYMVGLLVLFNGVENLVLTGRYFDFLYRFPELGPTLESVSAWLITAVTVTQGWLISVVFGFALWRFFNSVVLELYGGKQKIVDPTTKEVTVDRGEDFKPRENLLNRAPFVGAFLLLVIKGSDLYGGIGGFPSLAFVSMAAFFFVVFVFKVVFDREYVLSEKAKKMAEWFGKALRSPYMTEHARAMGWKSLIVYFVYAVEISFFAYFLNPLTQNAFDLVSLLYPLIAFIFGVAINPRPWYEDTASRFSTFIGIVFAGVMLVAVEGVRWLWPVLLIGGTLYGARRLFNWITGAGKGSSDAKSASVKAVVPFAVFTFAHVPAGAALIGPWGVVAANLFGLLGTVAVVWADKALAGSVLQVLMKTSLGRWIIAAFAKDKFSSALEASAPARDALIPSLETDAVARVLSGRSSVLFLADRLKGNLSLLSLLALMGDPASAESRIASTEDLADLLSAVSGSDLKLLREDDAANYARTLEQLRGLMDVARRMRAEYDRDPMNFNHAKFEGRVSLLLGALETTSPAVAGVLQPMLFSEMEALLPVAAEGKSALDIQGWLAKMEWGRSRAFSAETRVDNMRHGLLDATGHEDDPSYWRMVARRVAAMPEGAKSLNIFSDSISPDVLRRRAASVLRSLNNEAEADREAVGLLLALFANEAVVLFMEWDGSLKTSAGYDLKGYIDRMGLTEEGVLVITSDVNKFDYSGVEDLVQFLYYLVSGAAFTVRAADIVNDALTAAIIQTQA